MGPSPRSKRFTICALAALLVGCSGEPHLTLRGMPTAQPPEAPATEPSPPPFREPYFPFLDDEDQTLSVSVGDTSDGYLVNANQVTESDALTILPKQKARDLAYGSDEMVALLQGAATRHHARSQRPLFLGNVGRRGGGDIRYSVSHNAGRDADVAFAYLDAAGVQIDPPDLVPVDAEGNTRTGLQLDVATTWSIVRALLEGKEAFVQYLFVSTPIRKKLLRYAAGAHEPLFLIERAEEVLVEPAGAPHDDHLHVRIYCGKRDVGGGCVDVGPHHAWVPYHASQRQERAKKAKLALSDGLPSDKAQALKRLVLLDAREDADLVAARLEDASETVRRSAAEALGHLGGREHVKAVGARYALEDDPRVKVALLRTAGTLGGEAAGKLLRDVIASPPTQKTAVRLLSTSFAELASPVPALFVGSCLATLSAGREAPAHDPRRDAVLAAKRARREEPVAALTTLVADTDADLAAAAVDALTQLLNRRPSDVQDPGAWRSLLVPLQGKPHDAWLAKGFLAAGYKVPTLEKTHAFELVRALGGEPYLAANAELVLEQLFEHAAKPTWARADRCEDWLNWLSKRRGALKLPEVPATARAACERLRGA